MVVSFFLFSGSGVRSIHNTFKVDKKSTEYSKTFYKRYNPLNEIFHYPVGYVIIPSPLPLSQLYIILLVGQFE